MPIATYPQDEADYVAGLEDADFLNGGHRTNFIPSLEAVLAFAAFCLAVATEMEALGEQVEEDAASAAAGSGTEASVANIRAIADVAHYISMRRIAAANAFVALTDGATINWDMSTGINFEVTLGAAGRALANPTGVSANKSGMLTIRQDATGGRTITSWGSKFRWFGPQPSWPLTANAETLLTYFTKTDTDVIYLTYGGNTAS